MRYYFLLLLTTLCFFTLTNVQAQDATTHPLVMVPYNDHGKWGYSDTLGNLQIAPEYEEAGFFFRRKIGEQQEFVSNVTTEWGKNLLHAEGDLLLPQKTNLIRLIYNAPTAPGSVYLLERQGKYGIYHLQEKWLAKPQFDSLWYRNYSVWYLLKKDSEDTFTRFNTKTLRLEPTNLISAGDYWNNGSLSIVGTTKDGKRYELTSNGIMNPISEEEFASYEASDDLMFEEMAEDWSQSYYWRGERPTAEQLGMDRLVDFKDYSNLGFVSRYPFQKAIIAQKDGQMGILDENGNTLLPFQYDRVRFADIPTEAILEKDDLFGYHLLFTHHPTIEPRYTSLKKVRQLPVSANWIFAIFRVEMNGQTGYIGENTVEYFDFE